MRICTASEQPRVGVLIVKTRSLHGGTSSCSFREPPHQLTPSHRLGSVELFFCLLLARLHALSRGIIAAKKTAFVNQLKTNIHWVSCSPTRPRPAATKTATLCSCSLLASLSTCGRTSRLKTAVSVSFPADLITWPQWYLEKEKASGLALPWSSCGGRTCYAAVADGGSLARDLSNPSADPAIEHAWHL